MQIEYSFRKFQEVRQHRTLVLYSSGVIDLLRDRSFRHFLNYRVYLLDEVPEEVATRVGKIY